MVKHGGEGPAHPGDMIRIAHYQGHRGGVGLHKGARNQGFFKRSARARRIVDPIGRYAELQQGVGGTIHHKQYSIRQALLKQVCRLGHAVFAVQTND